MSGIKVLVWNATEAGRLYPRYDQESDFLVVESRQPRDWPYGIDIDGSVVFDIDARRVLANFDLHIGMKRWLRDLEVEWPTRVRAGDLAFPVETLAQKSFSLPLRVRADRSARCVRIEIGDSKPDHVVALSDQCIALLAQDELAGFLVQGFDG